MGSTPMFTDTGLKNLQGAQDWLTDQHRKELDDVAGKIQGVHLGPVIVVPGLEDQLQDLSTKIKTGGAAKLLDPGTAGMLDAEVTPKAGKQTHDEHRLSFLLPNSDATALHLGAETKGGKDRGIRGLTEKHVHFEVTSENKTLITLGGPMQETKFPAGDGNTAATGTKGYAMATEGTAWHVAAKQHVLKSITDDLLLASEGQGKTAALHSLHGPVSIAGDDDVSMGTPANVWIGADPGGVVKQAKFQKGFEDGWSKFFANKCEKGLMSLLDLTQSMHALITKEMSVAAAAKEGQNGWENESNWSKAKQLVDLGKVISLVVRWCADNLDSNAAGKVSIAATTFASITGDIAASLYGNLSASVTSPVSASLLGGTASVKGLVWGSLWSAVGTSVKSLKDVDIKAENGELKMKGGKTAELSTGGTLKLAGKKNAQLCADVTAFVHGKAETQVACGAESEGTGLLMKPDALWLGKMQDPSKLDGIVDDKQRLEINAKDKVIFLGMEERGLKIETSKVMLRHNSGACGLVMDDSGTEIDGAKLLFG